MQKEAPADVHHIYYYYALLCGQSKAMQKEAPADVHAATASAPSRLEIIHLPPFLVEPVLVGANAFRKQEWATQRLPYAVETNIL
jgi:hypothetical protein